MPNHVINQISLSGDPEKIRSMLEAIKSNELGVGSVDFNRIIPMPESLDIEAGSRTDRGLKAYRDFIEVCTAAGTQNKELYFVLETKGSTSAFDLRAKERGQVGITVYKDENVSDDVNTGKEEDWYWSRAYKVRYASCGVQANFNVVNSHENEYGLNM